MILPSVEELFFHTDQKPLESIFTKPFHPAPKRLQGMLIRLQRYDLVVQYERGSRMFLADTLSVAYLPRVRRLSQNLKRSTWRIVSQFLKPGCSEFGGIQNRMNRFKF